MKGLKRSGRRRDGERGRNLSFSPVRPPTHSPALRAQPAFTLLELVIALLLVALLSGMIFTTAHSSLLLGNTVVKTQNEEMLHQAFFDFMENSLSSLPGNTRMELTVSDSGSRYLSDLTLQNVPLSFTWGGQERTAKAIRLSTVMRRSGYLDIVMSYYENEIIDPDSTGAGSSFASTATDEKPFAEIVLLTDVAYFEWRLLDGRTMEYQYDWDLTGRLPLQMELICAFGAGGAEMRQVFWIPPRQNPEVFMRQLQQGGGQGGQGGGGRPENPANPGDPATPPGISIEPGVLPPIPGIE